ncbi:hypothetical protein V8G54_005342 [Vigna mungo]|uniref:Uncharacterized protein n=1 Tax=Vigna mungo TaxID=3915 RepID=A0AAQ3NY51_VIGMU
MASSIPNWRVRTCLDTSYIIAMNHLLREDHVLRICETPFRWCVYLREKEVLRAIRKRYVTEWILDKENIEIEGCMSWLVNLLWYSGYSQGDEMKVAVIEDHQWSSGGPQLTWSWLEMCLKGWISWLTNPCMYKGVHPWSLHVAFMHFGHPVALKGPPVVKWRTTGDFGCYFVKVDLGWISWLTNPCMYKGVHPWSLHVAFMHFGHPVELKGPPVVKWRTTGDFGCYFVKVDLVLVGNVSQGMDFMVDKPLHV